MQDEPRGMKSWLYPVVQLASNWISAAGVVLVTAAAIFWLVLLFSHAGHETSNPYLGILLFVGLPALFFTGLGLIPAGLWLERRRRGTRELPPVDLRSPRVRRLAIFLAATTIANVVIASQLTYSTVSYMDSVTFCGLTCHKVMAPEFTAYQNSPHSRVECVKCHIGPGASWFVKSKLSGAHQLFAVALGTYERPIPTPVENLRPARDTCEGCHWPQKFGGQRLRVISKFAEDETNTRNDTVLMMHIGGGNTLRGIHGAHVGPGVHIRYAHADRKRQNIPLVEVANEGKPRVTYLAKGADEAQARTLPMREMDCVDCHNRPTHIFELPDRGMDRILTNGDASPSLPWLRKTGLELLKAKYASREEALSRIPAGVQAFYRDKHPEIYASRRAEVDAAARAVASIYERNIFPEMKLDWGTYINNIGHTDFPGCFRCHDEEHTASGGQKIGQDCSSCHEMLAMEEQNPKILTDLGMKF
jgi:hypothetical protein